MSDEEYPCDPGYCQLVEVSNYAKELKEKLAALLDAAEKVINSYWNSTDGVITGIYDLEAALARVKGETK